jgi:transposase-like protein
MPFICECGSTEFYTHNDEEITVYYDGDGEELDAGEIADIQQTHNWPYRCAGCEKEYSQLPPADAETEWIKQKERQYLKNSTQCPICESGNMEGGSIDVNGTSAMQSILCLDCDAEWTDIYYLKAIEIESYSPDFMPSEFTPSEVPNPNKAFKGN